MKRAATASTHTPTDSAAAPTQAPGMPPRSDSTSAVAAMAASRSTVPYATRRVRPERIRTPCRKRR